ncbi:uncharacterized protein LOC112516842 [Cynara cardunculus var. scolymus]|uniref:Uncharacterized protein n=1 Tax=Cynara cardunculus var. scolymus TaxID=59895 RepID=A0A118JVY3_CYNCS|nr:uncharacterized protein LOC112516842 [Cynara cardunculus var. scolymus]KVH93759.1 hypothetical protein Ccrd_004184 [Cynara cardunculus var. scolymus]
MTTKTYAFYSNSKSQPQRETCLCSPTNHPGSFRCSRHRNLHKVPSRRVASRGSLELALVAKSNSVKAFMRLMIKPSSHDVQRRRNFQQKPTRFCLLNGNGIGLALVS